MILFSHRYPQINRDIDIYYIIYTLSSLCPLWQKKEKRNGFTIQNNRWT
jgi:hypothetical protein